MYLDYWGFKTHPFINVPNRNVFFHSPQHEEAIHRLLYNVEHRKGVAMITGEVGCGKTTLIRALINYLPENKYTVVNISNPALDPTDLVRAVLLKLGDNAESQSKTLLLDRLQRNLESNARKKMEMVLAIDEAHMIRDNSTLDEIRMMLNMHSEGRTLLTMILLGQPPLLKKISELHPLNERISMRINLEPLDFINSCKYILYRLRQAGAATGIFSRQAVRLIYEVAEGIPLRLNNICDRSLVVGMMRNSRLATAKVVRAALADL